MIVLLTILVITEVYFICRVLKCSYFFLENQNYLPSSCGGGGLSKYTSKPRISILLPCHKEYGLIKDTIVYFEKLISENIDVYIITAKEDGDYRFSSSGMVEKHLRKCQSNIKHLYDKTMKSTKTSKLNCAIDYISEKMDCTNHFIAVYDFDSRPDIRTFKWILNDLEVSTSTVDVYQQVPLNLANYSSNVFLNSYHIQHFKRSLTTEGIPLFCRDKRVLYLMGSGMCINLKTIYRFGGFPKYSDDIQLGIKFFGANIKERVVPFYTMNRIVDDWKSLRNQLMRIYFGYFEEGSAFYSLKYGKKIVLLINFFYDFVYLLCGVVFIIFHSRIFFLYICFSILLNSFYYYIFNMFYKNEYKKAYQSKLRLIFEATVTVLSYNGIRLWVYFLFSLKKREMSDLFMKNSRKMGNKNVFKSF